MHSRAKGTGDHYWPWAVFFIYILVDAILQVLIPPTGNVIDVLALNSNLTSLVRLLKTAGLADELQGPGPFTIFAPNDEAFRSMRKENLQKLERDPQILKTFLKNHIVQGPERFSARMALDPRRRISESGTDERTDQRTHPIMKRLRRER